MIRQAVHNEVDFLTLGVLGFLAVVGLSACAARTDVIKGILDKPDSPYYAILDGQAQKGEGESAVYVATLANAKTQARFILGAHQAVGLAERGNVLYATVPDLRVATFPSDPVHNAIRIELAEPESGTVRVTAVSRVHVGLMKFGEALSAKQFQQELAAALGQPGSPQAPGAPVAPSQKP